MSQRVALFLDWQNVLGRAREAFHADSAPVRSVDGQIAPVRLGELICGRPPVDVERELVSVRVYCGLADPHENRTMFLARRRQCERWREDGATVITRPLQYLRNWPRGRKIAREKGIDVAIAVDYVTMASRGLYDVGIIFSADTDLRPALEYVAQHEPNVRAEVAAWRSGRRGRRLNFDAPYPTWCHYLDEEDYEQVRDLTNYRPAR